MSGIRVVVDESAICADVDPNDVRAEAEIDIDAAIIADCDSKIMMND